MPFAFLINLDQLTTRREDAFLGGAAGGSRVHSANSVHHGLCGSFLLSTSLFLEKFPASDAAVHASSFLYLFLAFGKVGFLAFCSLRFGALHVWNEQMVALAVNNLCNLLWISVRGIQIRGHRWMDGARGILLLPLPISKGTKAYLGYASIQ
jgi:hypothetical protein